MKKTRLHFFAASLLSLSLLTGCATTRTTSGGAVGVDRQQTMMLSSTEVNRSAEKAYQQTLQEAQQKNLLNRDPAQVQRVRQIANRLIPPTAVFRNDAPGWRWEVNVITSGEINAWCMPGGKIAVYTGIIDKLKLSDDELAAVMGHEMAHALREHARERLAKTQATNLGVRLGAQLLGLGDLGNAAAGLGAQLLTLKFSRSDETDADLVGLELAARAGYQPEAAVSLWQKMGKASGSQQAGLAFLSTHPSGPDRIRELQQNVPKVQGLYQAARKAG